jgi:hypothetical protein
MFKRSKPPLKWPGGSAGFLDAWSSTSDRVLHAVLHPEVSIQPPIVSGRVESERKRRRTASFDDHMAIAVLALLGMSGVAIGWGLFA